MVDLMLETAIKAARAAGTHAYMQTGCGTISYKDPIQLVTPADKECQDIIVAHIKEKFPDHGIIAEEGPDGAMLKEIPKNKTDFWWVIDPIDGTRNYAHGGAQYVVSIGIIKNGTPILGVIYDPNTNYLYYGKSGKNAFIVGMPPDINKATKITCLNETLNENSQLAFSGTVTRWLPKSFSILMNDFVCMNLGSAALHYAYVASGIYSAAYSCNIKLWDIAAGAAICLAAEGQVCDINGIPRFPFDLYNYTGQPLSVLMATENIIRQLVKIFEADKNTSE
ncbi:MAG: inositol monophosphatase [Sedimentisphaerales bacterium]|nr:inositol monophosphatase [Sedimentisphaerales bacterium]